MRTTWIAAVALLAGAGCQKNVAEEQRELNETRQEANKEIGEIRQEQNEEISEANREAARDIAEEQKDVARAEQDLREAERRAARGENADTTGTVWPVPDNRVDNDREVGVGGSGPDMERSPNVIGNKSKADAGTQNHGHAGNQKGIDPLDVPAPKN